jgi:carbamoyltransferase
MLFTLPVRPERRSEIAAVVHVDGTTRPQSVTQADNPTYHAVISEFHRLTGVPMVLNTSFNTAFEPIVQSPEDAISSFLQLGVDALAIEGYLVERPRP